MLKKIQVSAVKFHLITVVNTKQIDSYLIQLHVADWIHKAGIEVH
jgi:hypothetical protein